MDLRNLQRNTSSFCFSQKEIDRFDESSFEREKVKERATSRRCSEKRIWYCQDDVDKWQIHEIDEDL